MRIASTATVSILLALQAVAADAPKPAAAAAAPAVKWSAECSPNYADRLLAPIEGQASKAELVAEWTHWPIRVAVLDEGRYANPRLVSLARMACLKWVTATSGIPGGGVRMDFEVSRNPVGADVVIEFCRREDIGGFKGFTKEKGSWLHIGVASVDAEGKPAEEAVVLRCLVHELGHSLGIWGHSPDPRDAMSLDESPREITVADVNTLRLAYRRR